MEIRTRIEIKKVKTGKTSKAARSAAKDKKRFVCSLGILAYLS